MTFYIKVNPVNSKFAKALQTALRAKVVNKVFRVDHHKLITNYFHRVFSVTPFVLNKVEQFNAFTRNNISCPAFTTDSGLVSGLGSSTVFARTLVNSTGGRGIVEFEVSSGQVPPAPLYTAYIPKKAEYRVHVFAGEVIDIQQKKKRRDFDDERNTRVRNMANGYVYTREGVEPPEGLNTLAINAVNAVGYMYGAVDIIYNEKRQQCYVLEVNSRPGLMGTTLDKYTEALIKHYNLIRK